ncbi:MAG: acetyl-CoA carboxylase carboxyl transferase subunit beta [Flavobacteriales bacterium]|nr:acetyl-CoA carboxylase carboxyl transferase subunit beta [Flavobacteriales bacterium]|tara:strand:- start:8179 stop:9021 length:843 start_codon:yes stop_codon:yes gene_type:complete
MGWFKRIKGGITTATHNKKETPDGLWSKCPKCKTIVTTEEHRNSLYVCTNCNHHSRIGSSEYFNILFDNNKFKELDKDMTSLDPLKFSDKKSYRERLKSMKEKTGLNDAVRTAYGKMEEENIVIACMDFSFIGGSMGSVVGEKISRAIDFAIKKSCPIIIISKSGGARMMEAGISLMQLAKTSAKLAQLGKKRLPYISLCTDPTFGGATASFSMLGDLNIAEPNALIGFAGPKVVKETIGKDLPKGFQTAEFLLEKGFIDMIINRKDLKEKLSQLFKIIK